jgi:hypothetical protein
MLYDVKRKLPNANLTAFTKGNQETAPNLDYVDRVFMVPQKWNFLFRYRRIWYQSNLTWLSARGKHILIFGVQKSNWNELLCLSGFQIKAQLLGVNIIDVNGLIKEQDTHEFLSRWNSDFHDFWIVRHIENKSKLDFHRWFFYYNDLQYFRQKNEIVLAGN